MFSEEVEKAYTLEMFWLPVTGQLVFLKLQKMTQY